MNDYKLHGDFLDIKFVATGVAHQAYGELYRLRNRKHQKAPSIPNQINKREEAWSGSGDYWLGRTVLTDLVVKVPGEGLLLINDATVNVALQKQIVQTALVGRAGTIKEYITDGDYQLNISVGLAAVDDNGELIDQYPERAVAQLREILERPEALEVSSAFLDLFGITHMVVTGFSAKQMTHANRQVIEITALSDTEYVIESNDY